MKSNLHTTALFRYKVGVIRGAKIIDGKIVGGKRILSKDWKNNLILDSGLNKAAATPWAGCFTTAIFGDQVSPDPVQRDSGTTTFSQSGTTITASGNFFVASDTGRLFKFDSGEECYLTYVNATTATASISRTVGTSEGTVWYVNQTAVQSVFEYSTAYGAAGGDNGTSAASNVITFKRTFTGDPAAGPTTLTEIGFNNGASNSNIFDRDIIVGGVSILTGDIPLAVAELLLTFPQNTSGAVGNVATGYDSSGLSQVGSLRLSGGGPNLSYVTTTGGTTTGGSAVLDNNYSGGDFHVATSAMTFPAFTDGDNGGTGASTAQCDGNTLQGYSSGNFYRDLELTFSITAVVGTIYGYMFRPNSAAFMQSFTTPFAKSGTQTLEFMIRKSWQRILTN